MDSTTIASLQADHVLLTSGIERTQPKRLDFVFAHPAVQAAFAALWPTLTQPHWFAR